MAGTRSYVSGNFMFNLDGVNCGFVTSADGGDAVGEVVEEKPQPGSFTKKQIGALTYDDIELNIGFGMAQDVYDWIAASLKMSYMRKDGSIVVTDPSFQAKSERQFFNALITELTIPKLDAGSKDAAFLTVKFAPEYTRDVKASGKLTAGKTPAQKQFVGSNFRFELGDLPCNKVSKIESFTVTQTIATDDVGDARGKLSEPGKLEFPNLRVSIAEVDAGLWFAWHEDFLIKGNCDDSNEKSGAIVFLSPNRQAELGRVNLYNVGIFALRHESAPTGTQVSHVVAELYCERMELQIGKAVAAPPVPVSQPLPLRPVPLPRQPGKVR